MSITRRPASRHAADPTKTKVLGQRRPPRRIARGGHRIVEGKTVALTVRVRIKAMHSEMRLQRLVRLAVNERDQGIWRDRLADLGDGRLRDLWHGCGRSTRHTERHEFGIDRREKTWEFGNGNPVIRDVGGNDFGRNFEQITLGKGTVHGVRQDDCLWVSLCGINVCNQMRTKCLAAKVRERQPSWKPLGRACGLGPQRLHEQPARDRLRYRDTEHVLSRGREPAGGSGMLSRPDDPAG